MSKSGGTQQFVEGLAGDVGADHLGWTNQISCLAMRLLYADGWSKQELSMTFMLDADQAMMHVRGDCCHDHDDLLELAEAVLTAGGDDD